MIEEALFYKNKLGFSVIPIHAQSKKPLIAWRGYQKEHTTDLQIKTWWRMWPTANIAIITGSLSGIAVVDIDTEAGYEKISQYIPPTLVAPRVKTPSGGEHIYFRFPKQGVTNNVRVIEGCDLRGEGGYVLAPPSRGYEWKEKEALRNIPELPADYFSVVKKVETVCPSFDRELFNKGTRDDDLFHTANVLFLGGMEYKNVLQIVTILAQNCNPPCSAEKASAKVNSAWARISRRRY